MLALDHLVVSGTTLAEAQAHVEDALGVPMQPGGQHAIFHTHNTLLGLADGLYLEAIAPDPSRPAPERPRWFDLDRFTGPPRLTNWAARTDNLAAALAGIDLPLGTPIAVTRGALDWLMAVPEDGALPFDNCAPALLEWRCPHPAAQMTQHGVAFTRLEIRHPDADALAAALAGWIDMGRIGFSTGAPALLAHFDTPHGPRQLGG